MVIPSEEARLKRRLSRVRANMVIGIAATVLFGLGSFVSFVTHSGGAAVFAAFAVVFGLLSALSARGLAQLREAAPVKSPPSEPSMDEPLRSGGRP